MSSQSLVFLVFIASVIISKDVSGALRFRRHYPMTYRSPRIEGRTVGSVASLLIPEEPQLGSSGRTIRTLLRLLDRLRRSQALQTIFPEMSQFHLNTGRVKSPITVTGIDTSGLSGSSGGSTRLDYGFYGNFLDYPSTQGNRNGPFHGDSDYGFYGNMVQGQGPAMSTGSHRQSALYPVSIEVNRTPAVGELIMSAAHFLRGALGVSCRPLFGNRQLLCEV